MVLESGEYVTVCDNFLAGYKGKVYGINETIAPVGIESRQSWTMQKVVIQDGEVISATGEVAGYVAIADFSENNNNVATEGNDNSEGNTESNKNDNSSSGDNTQIETSENDSMLPQTGEETNLFARWLTIVVILGVFWLCSMIIIDNEKKKMKKK